MKERDVAIRAAKAAGKVVLKYFGHAKVKYKSARHDAASIVTEADLKSESIIGQMIRDAFPTHNIIGEEKLKVNKGSDFTWYIDPIDGTSNFARGNPLFGISIGLVHKRRPHLGVLYFPALKLLIWGAHGMGSWANGKRCSVSEREIRDAEYYSTVPQVRKKIFEKVGMTKVLGASSYELAQIALGNAELYVMTNVNHDVAAGVAIVREAGGMATDEKGLPWTPDAKIAVISNGIVHKQVLQLL